VRLLRSWPAVIPDNNRHYVVDGCERLIISNHHYGALAAIDNDVLLLEWDMAVGQEELRKFARRAMEAPDRVLVAPYRIYADAYGLPADIWAHRRWDGTGSGTVIPTGATPVQTGDPFCQLFGFGMIYLPRDLTHRFAAAAWASHFGDKEFSMWHYDRVTHDVPIMWEIQPVHLNYLIPDLGDI
jgi:hypothetical protein